MPAIEPNTNLEGFIQATKDGIHGAFNKGVKYGRYLEQQDRLNLKDEFDSLLKRFRHLMQSDFIASFDQVDPKTQTYKRDIEEADRIAFRGREKPLYAFACQDTVKGQTTYMVAICPFCGSKKIARFCADCGSEIAGEA